MKVDIRTTFPRSMLAEGCDSHLPSPSKVYREDLPFEKQIVLGAFGCANEGLDMFSH